MPSTFTHDRIAKLEALIRRIDAHIDSALEHLKNGQFDDAGTETNLALQTKYVLIDEMPDLVVNRRERMRFHAVYRGFFEIDRLALDAAVWPQGTDKDAATIIDRLKASLEWVRGLKAHAWEDADPELLDELERTVESIVRKIETAAAGQEPDGSLKELDYSALILKTRWLNLIGDPDPMGDLYADLAFIDAFLFSALSHLRKGAPNADDAGHGLRVAASAKHQMRDRLRKLLGPIDPGPGGGNLPPVPPDHA